MMSPAATLGALLVLLVPVAARAAETSETRRLRVRAYDRSSGRLKAILTAEKTEHSSGVFSLRGVAVETTAARGSYRQDEGTATLSGGVCMVYRPGGMVGESAELEVARIAWNEGEGLFETRSAVRSQYMRDGRKIIELEGVGLTVRPSAGSMKLIRPTKIVFRGDWRMIGRLDGGGEQAAASDPVSITGGGPLEVTFPARKDRALSLAVADSVKVTEADGSLECKALVARLAPLGNGAARQAGPTYGLTWAEASGSVALRSEKASGTAERAEYLGDTDVLLLCGSDERPATLERPGQSLKAPRIMIDRKKRSITTGGAGDTRLSIRRPEAGAKAAPEPRGTEGKAPGGPLPE